MSNLVCGGRAASRPHGFALKAGRQQRLQKRGLFSDSPGRRRDKAKRGAAALAGCRPLLRGGGGSLNKAKRGALLRRAGWQSRILGALRRQSGLEPHRHGSGRPARRLPAAAFGGFFLFFCPAPAKAAAEPARGGAAGPIVSKEQKNPQPGSKMNAAAGSHLLKKQKDAGRAGKKQSRLPKSDRPALSGGAKNGPAYPPAASEKPESPPAAGPPASPYPIPYRAERLSHPPDSSRKQTGRRGPRESGPLDSGAGWLPEQRAGRALGRPPAAPAAAPQKQAGRQQLPAADQTGEKEAGRKAGDRPPAGMQPRHSRRPARLQKKPSKQKRGGAFSDDYGDDSQADFPGSLTEDYSDGFGESLQEDDSLKGSSDRAPRGADDFSEGLGSGPAEEPLEALPEAQGWEDSPDPEGAEGEAPVSAAPLKAGAEISRLEWRLGLGLLAEPERSPGFSPSFSLEFLSPLGKKLFGESFGKSGESLRWLAEMGAVWHFQGGDGNRGIPSGHFGAGRSYEQPIVIEEKPAVSQLGPFLQAGLRYSFSRMFYLSFAGGAAFLNMDSIAGTGSLFAGFEKGWMQLRFGIQSFSHSRFDHVKWSFSLSAGGLIKKWRAPEPAGASL